MLDGLPCEFYKALYKPHLKKSDNPPCDLILALQRLYHKIRHGEALPEDWTDRVLTLLCRKGERRLLHNYRPLSVMNMDYKIFTEILMRWLLQALDGVLGDQQSAFLPGRLIDNNVRTIQYLTSQYKDSDEGMGIVFLDQEKAYDWVSHKFMWEALYRLGVPRKCIQWMKALYRGVKIRIYINGYKSKVITVWCGVQQGDSISCPLFIAVIEGLAKCILRDARIQGVQIGNRIVKTTMYADDTTVFIRSQEEADALTEIPNLYGRATGSKINREKSYLLLLRALRAIEIHIPGIRMVSPQDLYMHLGVPVGVNIEQQVKEF